jgi:hypothetical protein
MPKAAVPTGKYACGCEWRGLDSRPRCSKHDKPKNEVAQNQAAVTAMVERLKQRNLKAIRTSAEYRR